MKHLIHKVQQKLNLAVLVVYLFFAIVTSIILNTVHNQYAVVIATSNQLSENTSKKLELLNQLNQNTSALHVQLLQFRLALDISQKRNYKEQIDSLKNKNEIILNSLKPLISTAEEKLLFDKFQKSRQYYYTYTDNFLLASMVNLSINDPETNYEEVRKAYKQFKVSQTSFIDHEHTRFIETSKNASDNIYNTGESIELVLLSFIVISFLFSFVALKLYFKLKRHYVKLEYALAEKQKATKHASSILNALPAHIALIDKTGLIIEANHSWKTFMRQFDYTTTETTGTYLLQLLKKVESTDGKDQVAAAIQEILDGKTNAFSLTQCLNLGNKNRWFNIIANKENRQDDSGIIIMYLDITDKQEAEEKSKQAEARLIEFNKNSQDIICSIDAEGRFIHVSDAAKVTWGYEPVELRGKFFKDLVYEEDWEITMEASLKIMEDKPVTMFENRYVHKNGTIVPMLWSARWKKEENTIYCVARDSSEKKKAEQELKNAEADYREIFEKASNGIFILDAHTHEIIRVNQKSCDITGYKKEELINQSIHTLSFFSKLHTAQELNEVFAGEDKLFELEIKDKTNQTNWIEVICTKANIAGTLCILVFFNKINSRKHVELTNARITDDLVQRNIHLQEFAYIVSHNLRPPVSSILGISNILKGTLTPEEKNKTQEYLFRSVENLDEIVKDLNHILELRSAITKTKEVINMRELVNGIKYEFETNSQLEDFQITADFTAIENFVSHKINVHCIFHNLISNSIKYRRKNQNSYLSIQGEKHDKKILISFKDNGMGMDMSQYESKIFGLYSRFHTNAEGKGMGLFLVKNHLTLLGGSIRVNSKLNVGTEFIIELPA